MANDLIASLREELSTTKQAADEGKACRSDLHSTRETLEATESRVTELMDSLTSSQNEIKALHARLAATRAAGATVETVPIAARAQGAANGKGPANRTVMVGSAEAARAAQAAQMKENMYSDLTGLIMRNVDRLENADVYDCIQTGRNGSESFEPSMYELWRLTSVQPCTSNCPCRLISLPRMMRPRSSTCRCLMEIETATCWRFSPTTCKKRYHFPTAMRPSFTAASSIL